MVRGGKSMSAKSMDIKYNPKRSNRIRLPHGQRLFNAFNYVLLTVIILVTLYPFWHAVMVSISSPSLYMRHRGMMFVPLGFSLDSFIAVFKNPNILSGFMNTFIYIAVGVALAMLLSVFAAYAMTRKQFYFQKHLTVFMVITMFVSGGLIPLYLTVFNLGLINTRWSLILPALLSTYNIIVMKVYFASIPDSLEESASLDGANDFTILFRIILPMSTPIIAVLVLFYTVDKWNAWFYASIFLNKRQLFPISLILREILISNDTSTMIADVQVSDKEPIAETIKYATMMVTVIPIVIIYPFLQKYFIQGIMIGAVKE
jgi:putative aldouronate transport system permease protein